MNELPRCDYIFKPLYDASPTLRCPHQARYRLFPMVGVLTGTRYACIAHLAQVFDGMTGVCEPIIVRRLPDE